MCSNVAVLFPALNDSILRIANYRKLPLGEIVGKFVSMSQPLVKQLGIGLISKWEDFGHNNAMILDICRLATFKNITVSLKNEGFLRMFFFLRKWSF